MQGVVTLPGLGLGLRLGSSTCVPPPVSCAESGKGVGGGRRGLYLQSSSSSNSGGGRRGSSSRDSLRISELRSVRGLVLKCGASCGSAAQLSGGQLRRRAQIVEDGGDSRRLLHCSKLRSVRLEVRETEQLQEYLQNISNAMGLHEYDPSEHVSVSGSQVLMSMEGEWSLIWCIDGRFYERYKGPELTYEWAYDGIGTSWCTDAAGRVSTLDLDDREVCLLASWIRTGYWLTEAGQKQCSVSLEPQKGSGQLSKELHLTLNLKDSKVMAHLVVDNATWLPLRMTIKAFGSGDKWEYRDWKPILPGRGVKFPTRITHNPPAGGSDMYAVTSVKVENSEELTGTETGTRSVYALPRSSVVPRSTRYYPKTQIDNGQLPLVKMIQAESGHYLVRPLVDGRDIGYFIVDTGASSLTITSEKADEVGMHAFGEAYVTGVEGEVKCRFRRSKSFQIGPLTITDPIYMEVPMAGVVRGVSPVAGICGYDIFFHCTVEMSYKMGTISFFDPLIYKATRKQPAQWQSMYLLENVPHVPAKFNGNEAIFLLDTGAGGVDVIFHGRAVELFRLNESLEHAGTASVKGINTSGKGLQVQYGILETLEVAGQSFKRVKALFPAKGTCGSLDFSEYTAGVLCGDLLQNLLLVLDYEERRFAFIESKYASSRSKI